MILPLRIRRRDPATARPRGERGRSQRTRHPPLITRTGHTKVHAIQAGRLRGNKTTARATSRWSVLRRRVDFQFPAFVYLIEHPEGYIAVDTGMNAQGWSFPLVMRRFAPSAIIDSEEEEIGPQMMAAGLQPEDVRTVILTHLDVDHVGGVRWFPNAEVLVHRLEYEFASTFLGRMRYRPELWSSGFAPTLYDLDPHPYGPFPESKALNDAGDLRLVPIPGHSPGQVGVILRTNGVALLFAADHVLRQDWFVEDWAAGRLVGLGTFGFPKHAVETTRRIQRFTAEVPTVLLPAHDTDAPRRLTAMETIEL
jgi:N-acyl homoserine lactone hydrolase